MTQTTLLTARAAVFRNRANQAIRIPKAMSFPDDVAEVQVTKVGDVLTIKPARPSWESFFEQWVPQLDATDDAFFDQLAERRPVIDFD
ncbi:MAG: type II toxin-antitoxin system VapB family antitoxin [Propionibacteriaceae bacterium]|jgi:antitoxin VapB|nr:type II toxin-antitoxin system VapB family antitoxin [Propionibacteriaceae bacterium]